MSVVTRLKDLFQVETQRELASRMDVNESRISEWQSRTVWSPLEVARLIRRVWLGAGTHLVRTAVRPIVEFFPVEPRESENSDQRELFLVFQGDGDDAHPYLQGLRAELKRCNGLYIFYDSLGSAIYAGQTKKQGLWKEMNLAFNRKRDVQNIRRVRHPVRREAYHSTDERVRQITTFDFKLWEVSRYASAWEVHPDLIDDLEALLVRGFANDLMNVQMPKFTHQRRVESGE